MLERKQVKIGDVCAIEKGSTGLAKAIPGKYPLVATSAERKTSTHYQFDAKAVCIPLVSSTGHGKKSLNYVHYQEGKFALGSILAALIPKDEKVLSARYLHVYLQKNKDRILVPLMKGAANVSLSVSAISNIEIPIPPIKEQEIILDKIDSISDEHAAFLTETDTQVNIFAKLRQAILQEAIEGKLTARWREQNPELISGENHASKLLERIRIDRERLIKERRIRKIKPFSLITDIKKPFELPPGWVWCWISELFSTISTKHRQVQAKEYLDEGKHPVVSQSQELISGYSDKTEKVIKISKPIIIFGDHTREVKLINFDFIAGADGVKILNLFSPINERFFYYALKSFAIESSGYARHFKILSSNLFPLPPFAEQQAIVGRVDNLMAMTDELEKQVTERKERAKLLMQSVLREVFEYSRA